jgi:KDO2-lipid IV(A) lauroyltransferase
MYYLLKFIGFFLKLIPRKFGYLLFEFFSIFFFVFTPKKRHNLKKNLSAVLNTGKISLKQLFAVYKNYARYYFDLFYPRNSFIKHIDEKLFENEKNKILSYLEKYNGCIVASLHLGNWDLGGAYLSYLFPGKINVVVERLSPAIFKWFKETREKFGMKVIESTDIKTMLKALKNKEVLVLLCDRDLEKTGFKIDFFGKKAYIPSGPAKLALTAKVPILFAALLRNKKNTLKFIPYSLPPDLNLDTLERNEQNVIYITRQLLNKMEKTIKENPEQWCMLQNIWCE